MWFKCFTPGKVFIPEQFKMEWRPEMHIVTFSAGVLSIAISIYLMLGIAYPFIAAYEHPVWGTVVLLLGGSVFGAFGSLLCWEAANILEDRKTEKKIKRKRRRKLVLLQC